MTQDRWYAEIAGEERGPLGTEELRALANSGALGPHDPVWREGEEPLAAADVPETGIVLTPAQRGENAPPMVVLTSMVYFVAGITGLIFGGLYLFKLPGELAAEGGLHWMKMAWPVALAVTGGLHMAVGAGFLLGKGYACGLTGLLLGLNGVFCLLLMGESIAEPLVILLILILFGLAAIPWFLASTPPVRQWCGRCAEVPA